MPWGVIFHSTKRDSASRIARWSAADTPIRKFPNALLFDQAIDVATLIAWSKSSAFGNFLIGVSAADQRAIRDALSRLVEWKITPHGIQLERYLLFATARKPS